MKLQNSLQSLQNKVDETNAMLAMEREAALKVVEEAQILVQDTENISALSTEEEYLRPKVSVHAQLMILALFCSYNLPSNVVISTMEVARSL